MAFDPITSTVLAVAIFGSAVAAPTRSWRRQEKNDFEISEFLDLEHTFADGEIETKIGFPSVSELSPDSRGGTSKITSKVENHSYSGDELETKIEIPSFSAVSSDSHDGLSKVISKVESYSALPEGWDGPGSASPSGSSLQSALAFLKRFPGGLPIPEAMISPSGEIGLYWNEDAGYADVNFDETGAVSFFSKDAKGIEFFEENMIVGHLDRARFFSLLGGIAAPVLAAA